MAPNRNPIDLKSPVNYAVLKDRNVLITGGASGLAKGFVHMFTENGANVVIADVQDGPGKQLEKELVDKGAKIKFIYTDVASFESQVALLRQALDFFPRNEIDIYVPAAGIGGGPVEIAPQDPAGLADLKTTPKELSSRVINVNLSAVFVGTMLVARYGMGLHKTPGNGTKSIVLIASLAGYSGANEDMEYTCAKWGVRGLMRAMRKHLAGFGVRINLIAPFFVETPLTVDSVPALQQAGIPIATVEQVTEAAARLATDENAYGRAIFVMPEGLSDGGDDTAGFHGGKSFSTEALGEFWAMFVDGPLSDEIQVG